MFPSSMALFSSKCKIYRILGIREEQKYRCCMMKRYIIEDNLIIR
jgi:hypothetical protein